MVDTEFNFWLSREPSMTFARNRGRSKITSGYTLHTFVILKPFKRYCLSSYLLPTLTRLCSDAVMFLSQFRKQLKISLFVSEDSDPEGSDLDLTCAIYIF